MNIEIAFPVDDSFASVNSGTRFVFPSPRYKGSKPREESFANENSDDYYPPEALVLGTCSNNEAIPPLLLNGLMFFCLFVCLFCIYCGASL